eukprot:3933446-Rhodomonas_salina.3
MHDHDLWSKYASVRYHRGLEILCRATLESLTAGHRSCRSKCAPTLQKPTFPAGVSPVAMLSLSQCPRGVQCFRGDVAVFIASDAMLFTQVRHERGFGWHSGMI